MDLAFTNLLIIVAAGFAAPLALGFFPAASLVLPRGGRPTRT
jgi:hypothetical protein